MKDKRYQTGWNVYECIAVFIHFKYIFQTETLPGNGVGYFRQIIYYYYHCHSGCNVHFRADDINKVFEKKLMKLLPNPGKTKLYASVINDADKKKLATGGAEGINGEINSLKS